LLKIPETPSLLFVYHKDGCIW